MTKTELHMKIPFNMDSPFIQLYFGKDKKRLVSYNEFSQFLHDFHEEYAIEGFRRADKNGTGFISVLDFQEIMTSIKSHLLTKQVQSHLIEVKLKLQQHRRARLNLNFLGSVSIARRQSRKFSLLYRI